VIVRTQLVVPMLAVCLSLAALAQPIEPVAPEERAPERQEAPIPDRDADDGRPRAVIDRVEAPFLSEQDRAALRVEHGMWTRADRADPTLAARIALDTGALDDPALTDPAAPALLRARAALRLGDPHRALAILDEPEDPTVRTRSTRARALELLGRTDKAIETLGALAQDMDPDDDATTLAEGALALADLLRLRGPRTDAEAEYRVINTLLARAREREPLNWRVRMAEARLLYDHHNRSEARDAAVEALRLNPRAAAPARLVGHLAVDSFDTDGAERVATRLDRLASLEPDTGEPVADEPAADEPALSIGGAIVRARAALRRRDPEGARAALGPVLARFPDHPMLLALGASTAAAGYKEDATADLLTRFDERFPGSALALVWVGRTLAEARQYARGALVLERAIERAPYWGEPRLHLGLLLVQAARDAQARRVLARAIELDPFNVRANNSLELLDDLAAYETIESEHFVIRYKAGPDAVLAREMPEVLERIHRRVCADIPGGMDHEPERRTIIEIMPTHAAFAVRIGGMPSIHTMAASTGPIIAIEAPRSGPGMRVGPYDWARVLQHEYTHTVNLSYTNNRVIHWMTEANAVYNEDAPRTPAQWSMLARAHQADDLFDLDGINTAFVRPEEPGDRSLAYAQGAWMYEYIVERFGARAPRRIMRASAQGLAAPDAFEDTLGITPESFLADFRAWGGAQLRARGLVPPQGAPALKDLVDLSRGAPPPSAETLDALIETHGDLPDLIALRAARALRGANDRLTPGQLAWVERALAARPEDPTPHKRLVRHHMAADAFEDQARAVPHLEYLAAREIHTPAYDDQLARLRAAMGDHDRALAHATRATRVAPFDAPTREQAARMALLAGDRVLARRHLEALRVLEPDRPIHEERLNALDALGD